MISRHIVASATALLLGVAVLVPVSAPAQTQTSAQGQARSEPSRAATSASATARVRSYALAQELYAYGKASKDALAVVAAAALLAKASPTETKREKTQEGTSAGNEDNADALGSAPDLSTMLATARELAGKNQNLLAMIDDMVASTTKEAMGGVLVARAAVLRNMTDVYRIAYRGGELAEVAIKGDGDTNLDLFVYDENGNEICRDQLHDSSLIMYCRWTPRNNDYFTVKVRNRGSVRNTYTITTN